MSQESKESTDSPASPISPYITFSGDSCPESEDFSKYNNKGVRDLLRRYKGITINKMLYTFLLRDTPQCVEESIKGQGLESVLRFIINPDGTFMGNCYDNEWLRSQIVDVKFIESDVKTDSDGDDINEDDEGEESTAKRRKQDVQTVFNHMDIGWVHTRIQDIHRAHIDLMKNKNPFYGNDVIKRYIEALVRLALFDTILDFEIQLNTCTSTHQVVHLCTKAYHESTKEEMEIQGLPDIAVHNGRYRILICEGKSGKKSNNGQDEDEKSKGETSKENDNEGPRGEGQLILAMLVEFVQHLMPVYGFTINPTSLSIFNVFKEDNSIVIQKVFEKIHNGRNILQIVSLIHWIRYICQNH